MRRVRASWVVALAAIAAMAAVPALRQQARGAKTAQTVYQGFSQRQPGWESGLLAALRSSAISFVQQRYPTDPEMLMAAGLLAPEPEQGLTLLARAVQLGRDPMYHAAYVRRLIGEMPGCTRIGAVVLDPADPKEVAQAQRQRPSPEAPERLFGGEVAPMLNALRDWETADPDNGLPHALEAYYLYGVHRDGEAKQAWERAGKLPQAREYGWPTHLAIASLLNGMGMVKAEAALLASGGQGDSLGEGLRPMVRYAWYEGRVAQVQGRDEEAVRWWSSTVNLGRHMQESADTKGAFMDGVLVEEAGALAAWRVSYNPGRTLYFGLAHTLYAAQVGPKADAQVRDDLLRGEARIGLLQGGHGPEEPDSQIVRATGVQGLAGTTLVLAVWCVAIAGLAGLLVPRAAEAAARSGWMWPVLTAIVVVALVLAGPTWTLVHPRAAVAGGRTPAEVGVSPEVLRAQASFLAALLAVVGMPFVLALRMRAHEVGFDATAWGGNLRRSLPVVVAALALSCLTLNVVSAKLRTEWLATWTKPGTTVLSVQISRIGPEWDRPPLPKQPWVAADPPESDLPRGMGSGWPLLIR